MARHPRARIHQQFAASFDKTRSSTGDLYMNHRHRLTPPFEKGEIRQHAHAASSDLFPLSETEENRAGRQSINSAFRSAARSSARANGSPFSPIAAQFSAAAARS